MSQVTSKELAPAEPWLWDQLGSPLDKRYDEIDCRFTSCAALILSHTVRPRFLHVTVENPMHANPLVAAVRSFRLGKGGDPGRDGTLIFPDILHDEVSEKLATRYLDKMAEVESEVDPNYESQDYLYLVHAVEDVKSKFVEEDTEPKSSSATEELLGSLAHGAGQPDKPLLVVISDEPWMHVKTGENDSVSQAITLGNKANFGIVINEMGLAHSHLGDPDYVDFADLQEFNR